MEQMSESRSKPFPRRFIRAAWTCAAFFAVGYFPTYFLKDYRWSILLATALAMPFGSKARTILRGMIRGGVLGLITGLSIASAVTAIHSKMVPPMLLADYVACISGVWAAPSVGTDFLVATALHNTLTNPYVPPPLENVMAMCVLGSVVTCSASAGLFAFLAAKRREKIERQWRG